MSEPEKLERGLVGKSGRAGARIFCGHYRGGGEKPAGGRYRASDVPIRDEGRRGSPQRRRRPKISDHKDRHRCRGHAEAESQRRTGLVAHVASLPARGQFLTVGQFPITALIRRLPISW